MNNELKLINKKIKFINEIIGMDELFKDKPYRHIGTEHAQERHLEIVFKKYEANIATIINWEKIIKKFRFFGDKSLEIKRIIKNDKLEAVFVLEEDTGARFPYSTTKFLEMISEIKFK